MNEEWLKRLDDAFEPTPPAFTRQVRQALAHPEPVRARKPRRLVLAVALALTLLAGTALALGRLGALYFLTERVAYGPTAQDVQPWIVEPLAQSCESERLALRVRDAYIDGEKIALCVSAAPRDPDAYRLLCETDIGTDGETFDRIWWNGQILSFEEWLPEGKEMLVVSPRYLELGEKRFALSSDWLPEETGEIFLLEACYGESFQTETITVRVAVRDWLHGAQTYQTSYLTCTLPVPEALWKEEKQ